MADVIQLDHARKEFGSFVAVEDANFSIRAGEFFAMLGPSGCGKTTTLRMIAGFEQPTSGRVLLEGNDVTDLPPYRRSVNTVFQQYALFPHMSIFDNVAFGPRSKKLPEAEVRDKAKQMLEVVRLSHLANRRPAQLSGGQQQRVALARALVNYPSALLLDEPLAALDLKLREAMQLELKRIQREVGITFVFVTHDQGEALTMSDRIAVMSDGRVEQIGTPEEIYNRPASIFVAGFIGSANLLPGKVVGAEDGRAIVELASGLRVRANTTAPLANGVDATLMLRPERLHVAGTPTADGASLPLRVTEMIFQGDSTRMIGQLADRTELVAILEPDDVGADVRPGDEIRLTWSPNAALALAGRSAVVGATSTDVDEVQAALDGASASASPIAAAAEPHAKRRFGRRTFLLGAGTAVVAAAAVGLASVGGNDSSDANAGDGSGDSGSGGSGASTLGTGETELRILNWQAYIDPSEDGAIGSVERFDKETGIATSYSEDFNDNNEVFNRILQPVLGVGQPIDYDIVVPTYWMASRLKSLGWLEPLPLDQIPNAKNLDPQYLSLAWDRGANYHLPWQAGITGIAYNPALTGRPLTSLLDLLDPEFKGKVAMLTEMRDSVGLMMLAMGADPSVLDEAAANAALDKIEEAKNSGQIRAFTGNEYLRSLESGDFVACVAWSGDIVQLQYTMPDIQFVIPDAGGMSWFDTMVIPKGSPNGGAIAKWMNFVYDPVNAAQITNYVQYVSPVVGVKEELIKMGGDAAALAESPILFPSDEDKKRLHVFASLPDDVDAALSDRFLTITGA